jgi:hypothetical protein
MKSEYLGITIDRTRDKILTPQASELVKGGVEMLTIEVADE